MKLLPLALLNAPSLPWALEAQRVEDPVEPSPWRTYQWAYRDAADGMSPLTELHLRAAIERHLSGAGFQRSDPPQLTVAFFLERKPAAVGDDDHVFARDRWSLVETKQIDARSRGRDVAGALVVDICDARTFRTVWRGVGSRLVRQSASRTEIEDAVISAMQGLPLMDECLASS
jgi:hypothetical protein